MICGLSASGAVPQQVRPAAGDSVEGWSRVMHWNAEGGFVSIVESREEEIIESCFCSRV